MSPLGADAADVVALTEYGEAVPWIVPISIRCAPGDDAAERCRHPPGVTWSAGPEPGRRRLITEPSAAAHRSPARQRGTIDPRPRSAEPDPAQRRSHVPTVKTNA